MEEKGRKRKKMEENGRVWRNGKNGLEWNKLQQGMEPCEREWTRKEDNGMKRMPVT